MSEEMRRLEKAGPMDGVRHTTRVEVLQRHLSEKGWDAALLFYSRDIFYYTGTAQPAYLLVTPTRYRLFICSGFEFAKDETGLERTCMIEERRLESIAGIMRQLTEGRVVGTELDLMTVHQYHKWKTAFPGFEFMDISPTILAQRRKKDAHEINMMKRACHAQEEGHRAVLRGLKAGMTELELAAAVESAHRLAGHEGVFFMRQPDFFMSRGPIGSGGNLSRFSGVVYSVTGVGLSPAVPAGPSRKRIEYGECVVVDIPTLVGGYHADQTRTYFVGKVPDDLMALHDALVEISDCVISEARPGICCRDLFHMAMDKAASCGVEDAFLSFGNGKRSHMIGHGIGLECTESPILSKNDQSILLEGEVLVLEMHMFREGAGVVKIEDMFHIGEKENEILTRSPRTLFEVEG